MDGLDNMDKKNIQDSSNECSNVHKFKLKQQLNELREIDWIRDDAEDQNPVTMSLDSFLGGIWKFWDLPWTHVDIH